MDDLNELESKCQADALVTYMEIVGQRASCLVHSVTQLHHLDEQERTQLTYLQMRVIILKKMASVPFTYTLKAGKRKDEVILMNAIHRTVTQSDLNDMIETIVDIVSAIWETRGLINKVYDTKSPAAPGNRGRLRSQERELWITASAHFQEQHNASSTSFPSSHHHSTFTSGGFISKENSTKATKTHKGIPPAPQSKYQKQYQEYMCTHRSISQKLQNENFLRWDCDSKRKVRDDPMLMQAQSKSGRENISSNRNRAVTGNFITVFPHLQHTKTNSVNSNRFPTNQRSWVHHKAER